MGKGNTKNLVLFVAVCMLIIFGWNYLEKTFWPPPKPTPQQVRKDVRKYIGFMGGAVAVAPLATSEEASQADGIDEFHKVAKAQGDAKPKPPPKPAAPKLSPDFVELGNKDFFLQVRFTNIGAAVDRVILTQFKHADEMGLWDKTHDRLNLIRPAGDRTPFEDQFAHPDDDLGSFLLYHYSRHGDDRPVDTLGSQAWKLEFTSNQPDADSHEVR